MAYTAVFEDNEKIQEIWYLPAGLILASLVTLLLCIEKIRDQLRIGTIWLEMDPCPAQIGEHASGFFLIKEKDPALLGTSFSVILKCTRRGKSGSSNTLRPIWTGSGPTIRASSSTGTQFKFKVNIPKGLPPSNLAFFTKSIEWKLVLKASFADLEVEREYIIPVQ